MSNMHMEIRRVLYDTVAQDRFTGAPPNIADVVDSIIAAATPHIRAALFDELIAWADHGLKQERQKWGSHMTGTDCDGWAFMYDALIAREIEETSKP